MNCPACDEWIDPYKTVVVIVRGCGDWDIFHTGCWFSRRKKRGDDDDGDGDLALQPVVIGDAP